MKLTIEKLIFGGLGLARSEKGVIFVSDVLPGEIVECVVERKQDGILVARPVEIVQPSAYRRNPDCPYFGECGGCDWLYIQYENQVQIKKEIFIDCLQRIAKLKEIPDIECFQSPEKEYRIRAQLKVNKSGECGFYRKKTNDIIPIKECPLLVKKCNEIINLLNRKACKTSAPSIKIITDNTNIASDPVLPGSTKDYVDITVDKKVFKVFGNSFFQSNRYLIETMAKWASPMVKGDYCVDLYGGTGLFSVMLGENFSRGILIESVRSQVDLANFNLQRNGCSQFTAVCSEVERLSDVVKVKPDLVIVDPPRPGLTKKALNAVVNLNSTSILYVSCNPSTQARDIGTLIRSAGYTIKNAALFDCYPNTNHIETAILLKKY